MQKRLVFLPFLVLSMCLGINVFPGAVDAQDAGITSGSREDMISALQKSVVLIGQARKSAEGGRLVLQHTLGTGFLVDGEYTVATVRSRFTKYVDRGRLVVKFRSPSGGDGFQILPAGILYEFPDKDLAFLRVEGSPAEMAGLSRLEVIRDVAEIGSLVGETVMIAGYPRLGDFNRDHPVLRRGMISSTDFRMAGSPIILLELLEIPGFSGAPVIVQDTGHVIGIIPGPEFAKGSDGFQWAVPVTEADYRRAINARSPSQ